MALLERSGKRATPEARVQMGWTARRAAHGRVWHGTARGIGETSSVLLTSGVTAVINLNPFEGPMISPACRGLCPRARGSGTIGMCRFYKRLKRF